MVLLLFSLAFIRDLGWIYLLGIFIATLLLLTEHRIIKPSNRHLMKIASYKLNQIISMVILFCTLLDFILL
ncbi:prenyltransferase [compost metagenome]